MVDRLPDEGQARLLPAYSSLVQRRNQQGAPSREQGFDPSVFFDEDDVVEGQVDAARQRPAESESGGGELLRPRFGNREGAGSQLRQSGEREGEEFVSGNREAPGEEEVAGIYRRNALSVFAPFPLGGNLDLVG